MTQPMSLQEMIADPHAAKANAERMMTAARLRYEEALTLPEGDPFRPAEILAAELAMRSAKYDLATADYCLMMALRNHMLRIARCH